MSRVDNLSQLENALTSQNSDLMFFEDRVIQDEYLSIRGVIEAHDIVLSKIDIRERELDKELEKINEYLKVNSECDKWDHVFASSAGVLAGLIDSFFVGSPQNSMLLSSADNVMDNLVQNFAKLNGWHGVTGGTDPIKSAIGFLERKFKVNYDHQYGKAVNDFMLMSTKNHHLKSLSHSSSPIGLIFSIVDQFRGTATFIDNGQLITVTSENELIGGNFASKIFCAFVNWLGHIMSDIAGSSGAGGRGSGIPVPFYELLQTLNIGSFEHQGEKRHFADIAVKVFEQGYDFRFGVVQSIPVLMVELFIRIFCIIRHRFEYNCSWKECFQFLNFDSNAKLRKMLLSGHGVLCLIDAGDAFVRSGGSTNWVSFFSHMNFVAWLRFSYLGIRQIVAVLRNEIEIKRYQLRAEACDNYVQDIRYLVDKFFIEHNRKRDKFFAERKQKLNELFAKLDNSDDLQAVEHVRRIGAMYGISSRMDSFEEFQKMIDEDDYD